MTFWQAAQLPIPDEIRKRLVYGKTSYLGDGQMDPLVEKAVLRHFNAQADRLQDKNDFIRATMEQLLSLGESWDETSSRKEAEEEWEAGQRYKEELIKP